MDEQDHNAGHSLSRAPAQWRKSWIRKSYEKFMQVYARPCIHGTRSDWECTAYINSVGGLIPAWLSCFEAFPASSVERRHLLAMAMGSPKPHLSLSLPAHQRLPYLSFSTQVKTCLLCARLIHGSSRGNRRTTGTGGESVSIRSTHTDCQPQEDPRKTLSLHR